MYFSFYFFRKILTRKRLYSSSEVLVTASADNCLLTCYPFIAQHRADHHIVCEMGSVDKGRRKSAAESVAIYKPCHSPQRPTSRPSTSATSTEFQISTSSYEDSQSITG